MARAESHAAGMLRGRPLGLLNSSNSCGLLFRRHCDDGVGDGQLNPAAAVPDASCSHLHLTLFGELASLLNRLSRAEAALVARHRRRGDSAHLHGVAMTPPTGSAFYGGLLRATGRLPTLPATRWQMARFETKVVRVAPHPALPALRRDTHSGQ